MMHRRVKFKQRKLYNAETVLSVQGDDPKRILTYVKLQKALPFLMRYNLPHVRSGAENDLVQRSDMTDTW